MLLRGRNDPRPPLGAEPALLPGGFGRRWRRRRLGFPSRPSFPLSRSHAQARGGACDALGRFVESERGLPFEARGPVMSARTPPRDRVRGNRAFMGPSEALSGGLHGRLDALPTGGGDSFSGGCGGGQGVRAPAQAAGPCASLDGEARAFRRAAIKAEEGPQSTIRRASTSVTGSGNYPWAVFACGLCPNSAPASM